MSTLQKVLLVLLSVFSVIALMAGGYLIFRPSSSNSLGEVETPAHDSMALKIYIAQEGMYEISAQDIKDAGYVGDVANNANIELINDGVLQPFWLEGNGQDLRIRFYGKPSDSQYSNENVYWLVSGVDPHEFLSADENKERNAEEEEQKLEFFQEHTVLPPDSFFARLQLEENRIYKPQVDRDDPWFWSSMTAPNQQSYDIQLPHLVGGNSRLRLGFWATTESRDTPDHHLIVRVNGHVVEDETWDGLGSYTIESDIEPGILQNGTNTIEIIAPGDTGVAADIVLLDEMEIGYPREYVAESDRLDFVSNGGAHSVGGLSEHISVYDITPPTIVEIQSQSDNGTVKFEGQVDHRYWISGEVGYLEPVKVEPAILNPDLRRPGDGVEYIAIGPPDLLQPLQPLLDLREEQGLKVLSVPLDAVYDQFGAGLPEPQAIREFLKYTQENWYPSPRYLLLVGDASYDPKGFISPDEANRLPVFLINTVYGGQTASDVGYAQLADEEWAPDSDTDADYHLAVGRIPARTASEVAILVEKILNYERVITEGNQPGPWEQNILAIADGQDIAFRADAQAFLDLFSGNYQTDLLSPSAGEVGVNQQIIDKIIEGNLLVAYFGHGSLNMWGKDRLFSVDDVDKLSTGDRSPIVINMTCLTGLFTHPNTESLAEAMLWKPDGGAVAVLAPTSLTLPNDQSFLVQSFVQTMLEDPSLPLGELLRRARAQVPSDTRGRRDVIQTFLLFGDPALRLPSPDN